MRSFVIAAAALGLVACARGGPMDVVADASPRVADGTLPIDAPPGRDGPIGRDAQDDAPPPPPPPGTHLVINEIDYDQIGTDGAEFIEIFNPTSSSASLSGLSIMLVNGATNTVYGTVDLSSASSLAAGGYLVLAGSGVTVSAGMKLATGWTTDAIQNGPMDGLALVDTNAKVVIDALAYEGAITAAQLTGFASPVSLVEGTALATSVADSNTVNGSLCRTPNGADTDDANADWKFCSTPTPGAQNM